VSARGVGLALALVGCTGETGLVQVEARLAISPPLVDLPPARVGDEVDFLVTLDHLQGDAVEVLDVSVLDLGGGAFSFTGVEGLELERGGSLDLPFRYAPTANGFHAAALVVTTDAADGVLEVLARGRALAPDVGVFPAAIDFGPVAAASTASQSLRLANEGDAEVVVDVAPSDTRFALGAPGPYAIPAGTSLTIPVSYTAVDVAPIEASLILRIAENPLATVGLRANDCPAGAPALYDVDGDGWTSCAGTARTATRTCARARPSCPTASIRTAMG
jgi:hypothetical protein